MLLRRFLLPLAGLVATFPLVSAVLAQPPPLPAPAPGRAYFYSEPGFRGEVFVVDGAKDVDNLAFVSDSRGRPFNNRVRSVQLEGPVRVLLFEKPDFRGATLWLNGAIPDLGAFAIGTSSRQTWDRNISSVQVQSVARDVVVFSRWERRDAERIVRLAYRDILSRDADAPGLRLYVSRLVDAGWSDDQLRDSLRRSDEFKNRNLEAITRRAYLDILGREADASGLATYKRSLSRGMTENEMREDLRRSREGIENQVPLAITRAYREVLRREPDAGGLEGYSKLMRQKGWNEADVRDDLRRSEEFHKLRRG